MPTRLLTEERLALFARALRRRERAAATVEKYTRAAAAFAAFLAGRPATKELAAEWKASLLAAGLAPATVNVHLSALNSLFDALGWRECRVCFLRLQPRAFRDPARALSRTEYLRLVSAARTAGRECAALLLETVCAAGIRVSELRFITVEAVRSGEAEIRLKGKIRTVLLPKKLCRRLEKFAAQRGVYTGAVFRAESGAPLSRFQVWRIMKSLCAAARVAPSKVFPHNLRHLFAVTFYAATRDLARLADLLGHSSVDTTRLYLLVPGGEHQRTLDRLGLVV